MRSHTSRAALSGLVALGLHGCATVGFGPRRLAEVQTGEARRVRVQTTQLVGEWQQAGETVTVFARRECTVRSQALRTDVHVYEQEREIIGADLRPYLLLGAAAGLALGGYLYANAESLAREDMQRALEEGETEYTTANQTRGAGIGFAAVGALAAVTAIVDTVRTLGGRSREEPKERRGAMSEPLGYCGEQPVAEAAVTLEGSGGRTDLGTTAADGSLEVAAAALREKAGEGPAVLAVDGVPVATWPQ